MSIRFSSFWIPIFLLIIKYCPSRDKIKSDIFNMDNNSVGVRVSNSCDLINNGRNMIDIIRTKLYIFIYNK